MAEVSPIILLDAVRRERDVRLAEASLSEFVKQAWHVVEPSTELKWGWALDAICLHLQAVSDKDIFRLLMNVPPGSMKSLLTNVFWPAWEWGPLDMPHMRFLSTAHKQDLAVRDNIKCRRLIQSDWYQERWPIILMGDQNAKTKFENDKTGFREAMAFTSMTGSRGDRVTLDDPLSVDDANSDAALAACESTFREALPTRVNNDESAIVVIMQRLHEKDPSGIILKEMLGYEHLMLPMEYEKTRRCTTSIGFEDPRKVEGELMFPERFGANTVTNYKKALGDQAYAGQMQQRPAPAGGGILKIKHFQLWPTAWKLPVFEYVVQSYDGAYDDDATSSNDPSACTVWGIFEERGIRGAILLDAWDDHLGYPDFRKKVLEDWHSLYGKTNERKGKKADAILVENKSSGISILQDLRRAKIPAIPYNPGRMSKIARAHAVSAVHEMDNIYILESSKNPGKFITWAKSFIDQVELFPNAEHDDYVDTYTQALSFLRDGGQLEMPETDETGLVYRNLYGAATDSYDYDEALTSSSKGSCWIYKRFLNADHTYRTWVAGYVERPETARGGAALFFERTAKLCILYNSINLIEWSKVRIIDFYKLNALHTYLKERPQFVLARLIKESKQVNEYGIDAATKPDWLKILRDYLAVPENIKKVYFPELLEAWANFVYDPSGRKYNCDITISTSLNLVLEEDERFMNVSSEKKEKRRRPLPVFQSDEHGNLFLGIVGVLLPHPKHLLCFLSQIFQLLLQFPDRC